ncbi:ABC transporter permease, partial [Escherichia coli]|uniref:ABC transporter permease n=1 Tax=Escherichia coli TaxID=562 RepID=UPI00350E4D34
VPAYGPQNDVTLKMPAFEWVHVQLHQQKGMISLSPPTICNSAAKNAGVNTRIIVMLTYVLSGLCAAIAGIIVAADIRGADANNAGLWLELDAILAVVIGGGSLMGGRFNLLLSVVGALIIQGMNTGILLSGFPPEMNQVVKAVVVLCVLIVQSQRFISLIKGVRSRDKT